jgi:hypothetical protein
MNILNRPRVYHVKLETECLTIQLQPLPGNDARTVEPIADAACD